ncbi:DUF1043 family protein [Alteromonas aestuariivivens]|uniref:DUF1043 family protein n=1 Tax=Alteromonas aestuariivivens TaxID=1938339 RepID=A0A3D8MD02_9ALTE|nr:DUF1043 family protein [Alteromonas aestuariivivens]RDV28120.1 DUF1043 family protein [Alteromonas aestuariivivens]
MDVLIPLALLVVGLIIGFFVARYLYTRDDSVTATKLAEKNIKELMAQQAEHHIFQSKQVVEEIERHCQNLRQQVEEYEVLLNQNLDEDVPRVPFYGEHASAYLRNNLKGDEKSKLSKVTGAQPRDFAGSGSGLFIGATGNSTAEKDQ